MHMLSVVLAGRETAIALWYRDGERALAAADMLKSLRQAGDDYGHHVSVEGEIAALLVTDIEREHAAQGEMAMLQSHAQASLQSKAQADPKLRFRAARSGGGLVG